MQTNSFLALDIGERRIGVAVADAAVRIARPLTTVLQDERAIDTITNLMQEHHAAALVVGMPRGLEGQYTKQSAYTEKFVQRLQEQAGISVHWQDEAVTSRQAEQELKNRGKPYAKGDIDALAATYILEDFLASKQRDKLEGV